MSKRLNQDRLSLSNTRFLKRPSTSDFREHGIRSEQNSTMPSTGEASRTNYENVKRPELISIDSIYDLDSYMDQVKKDLKESREAPLLNRSFMAHELEKKPRKRVEKNGPVKKATVSMNSETRQNLLTEASRRP